MHVLSERYGVSEMTIRRDLAFMERDGALLRTYGGAHAVDSPSAEAGYFERFEERRQEKTAIGLAVAQCFTREAHVFLDAGTTTWEVVEHLSRDVRGHIITNDVRIANRLSVFEHLKVTVIGGTLQPRHQSVVGPMAQAMVGSLRAETAYVGANGIESNAGFTAINAFDVEVKRAMIAQATRVVVLADSSKAGHVTAFPVARFDEVDELVTDAGLPDDVRRDLERAGVLVTISSELDKEAG